MIGISYPQSSLTEGEREREREIPLLLQSSSGPSSELQSRPAWSLPVDDLLMMTDGVVCADGDGNGAGAGPRASLPQGVLSDVCRGRALFVGTNWGAGIRWKG